MSSPNDQGPPDYVSGEQRELDPEDEFVLVASVIDAASKGVHPAYAHAWYLCGRIVTLDNWHCLEEQDRDEYTRAIGVTVLIHGRPLTPVPDLSQSNWTLENMLSGGLEPGQEGL